MRQVSLDEKTEPLPQGPSRRRSGTGPLAFLHHTAELAVITYTFSETRQVSIRGLKCLIESSGAIWT